MTFAGPVSQECWSSSDDLFLICLKWRQSGLERSLSEAAAVTACSFCLTVHASLSRTQELLKAAVCYIREVTHALKKKNQQPSRHFCAPILTRDHKIFLKLAWEICCVLVRQVHRYAEESCTSSLLSPQNSGCWLPLY